MPFKLDRLLNIFWQSQCPLCSRATPALICLDCDRQLQSCRDRQFRQPDPNLNLWSWGIYDGALKRAIATCKFNNHPEVAEALGTKMGEAWEKANMSKLMGKSRVVPIPLHPDKLKSRGFNQAAVMAKSFCNYTGLAYSPEVLVRVKNTKPQFETKSKQEREANLHQAFIAKGGKNTHLAAPILLLDDIYTSGTTVREAIDALEGANMRVCGAIVLARPQLQAS